MSTCSFTSWAADKAFEYKSFDGDSLIRPGRTFAVRNPDMNNEILMKGRNISFLVGAGIFDCTRMEAIQMIQSFGRSRGFMDEDVKYLEALYHELYAEYKRDQKRSEFQRVNPLTSFTRLFLSSLSGTLFVAFDSASFLAIPVIFEIGFMLERRFRRPADSRRSGSNIIPDLDADQSLRQHP